MGAWYIRITSDRRKEVDVNLIVQAVIALSEQLRQEAAANKPPVEPVANADPRT